MGNFYKLIGMAIVAEFIFPAGIFASSGSLVVVPIHDNVSDSVSDDIAQSFSEAFALKGFDVIGREKVEAVMGYYNADAKITSGSYEEACGAIIRAKEHYYNFEYKEAFAQIERAVELLEGSPSAIVRYGEILRDAYIVAGIIERSEKGHDDEAFGYFKKALAIDPQYVLNEKAFPPSIVGLFEKGRAEILAKPAGSISIVSDPSAAEIYINGIQKGVTPATISNLPEGSYNVAVMTNKYKPIEELVVVEPGKTINIKKKLNWAGISKNESAAIHNILTSPFEAREQINEGVRIAELLRVPKVVMVDVDEASTGSGEVAARMIDREFKSGHNPIVIGYAPSKKGMAEDLNRTADILADQYDADILAAPQKNLDPDGIGDPVLLGKRKKALYTVPAFWALVGGAIAATAGGSVAAIALSGDDGPKSATGSVNVMLK